MKVLQGSILEFFRFLLYANDLPQSLSEAASYFYVGDTCLLYWHEDV